MFGIVRNLKPEANYGFIRSDAKGVPDHFFHKSDCDLHWEDLVEDYNNGMEIKVEFESTRSEKGPRAESVRRLNG